MTTSFIMIVGPTIFNLGTHAFIHPRVALRNAEKLTPLNKEKDIILKHMFGATLAVPRYPDDRSRRFRRA